jgi:hypothetical protein
VLGELPEAGIDEDGVEAGVHWLSSGVNCLAARVGEPCAQEGAEAAACRAAAPARGELLLVQPEQLDELGRGLEGVGDHATRAERKRREQPGVGLGDERRAVEGPRAVERC